MRIRESTPADRKLAGEMARLHRLSFPDYMLSKMGYPFMKAIYRSYLESPESGVIIAENDDGSLAGLLSYMDSTVNIPARVVNRRKLLFWVSALIVSLRDPSGYEKMKRFYRKCSEPHHAAHSRKHLELGSFCLYPGLRGKGTGTEMLEHVKNMTDYHTFDYVGLTTASDDNDRVNLFYLRCGFMPTGIITLPDRRKMTVYQYSPEGVTYKAVETVSMYE